LYQRYYDGYPECEALNNDTELCEIQPKAEIASKPNNIFGSLKLDDILLLGILIVMLNDDCDDKLMLIIIGFLFVSGLDFSK